jgi:hypothetical protein
MKSIVRGGILEHVFNRDGQDKQTVRIWLLDGAPLSDETLETNHININSHENFKFQC